MKRLTGSVLAALLPVVGVGAATMASSSVASAAAPAGTGTTGTAPASPGTPDWQNLEQTGLQVAASAQGVSTLNPDGLPSIPVQSTVTTPSGPVSLSQQTEVSSGRSGTVIVDLAYLGNRQLIVSEVNPAENYQGETLVLAPGTSTVTQTIHLPGSDPQPATATTSALRVNRRHPGTVSASLGVFQPGQGSANLAAAYGCWAYPQPPGVIGSIYGPLIQGEGVIDCSSGVATLAIIAGIYQNNGAEKGDGGGSGYGGYLAVNSYAPCYQTSWNYFLTAQVWAVNGALQPGADSGWSYLGCT